MANEIIKNIYRIRIYNKKTKTKTKQTNKQVKTNKEWKEQMKEREKDIARRKVKKGGGE